MENKITKSITSILVGGCLAISGSVIQSILKNELASPYTLGVSAGASLGAGLVIISSISIPILQGFTLPVIEFIFGLATVFIVIAFESKIDKTMSNNTIILAGMVICLYDNAIFCAILTGGSVTLSGTIGFVDLISG